MTPQQHTQQQIDRYRLMTGEQRLQIGFGLHELSCQIARDGIRARYPNATSAFIEEALRKRLQIAYSITAERVDD